METLTCEGWTTEDNKQPNCRFLKLQGSIERHFADQNELVDNFENTKTENRLAETGKQVGLNLVDSNFPLRTYSSKLFVQHKLFTETSKEVKSNPGTGKVVGSESVLIDIFKHQ